MIVTVTEATLDKYLELMYEYQRFYKVDTIDRDKNRIFFENLLQKPDLAHMTLFMREGKALGFSTVYFSFSSTIASKVAVLNDLFVVPEARGEGIAKALIKDSVSKLEAYGCARLQWVTARDNILAQKLYKSLGAKESVWNFYTLAKGID